MNEILKVNNDYLYGFELLFKINDDDIDSHIYYITDKYNIVYGSQFYLKNYNNKNKFSEYDEIDYMYAIVDLIRILFDFKIIKIENEYSINNKKLLKLYPNVIDDYYNIVNWHKN